MIRRATHDDVPFMLDSGEKLHAECNFGKARWNRGKVEDLVRAIIDNDQYAAVYERDGKIVGYMCGYVIQPWYSDDFVAVDLSFYIEKGYRGSGRAAYKLLQGFIDWAKGKAIVQIRPGIATGSLGEAADRLYQSLGFERVGGLYLMEV